ncbi:MAG: hypothetical protein WCK15_11620 [Pirellula sp.]
MSATFEECETILAAFHDQYRHLLTEEGVHGVQVAWRKEGLVLEVLVKTEGQQRTVEKGVQTEPVAYNYKGEKKQISIRVVVRAIARAQARPGSSAHGDTLPGAGTLGWNVVLNGQTVCLSNWHVFCPMGNDTPLGWDLIFGTRREATLSAFQPLATAGNVWDYALGQYVNSTDASDHMRLCDDGTESSFPQGLSPRDSVRFGDGASYRKVGNKPPTCRTGQLNAMGNRDVQYHDGVTRSFTNQLIFSKMSDAGDSGAVIVRESDHTVTGLNFAGNDTETIANPFYLVPWTNTGMVTVSRNLSLPSFVGDAVPGYQFPFGRPARMLNAPSFNPANGGISSKAAFHDLPHISAGKSVLGVAAQDSRNQEWNPAPPDGTVDKIYLYYEPDWRGPEWGGKSWHLCLGPKTIGQSVIGYKRFVLHSPPTDPNVIYLGYWAPMELHTWLYLGPLNDPNATWVLGQAVMNWAGLWDVPPPPPPQGTVVSQFQFRVDKRMAVGREFTTTYFLCLEGNVRQL